MEMVDAALEAHFNVLENAIPAEELRRQYIERCIDELLLDSGNAMIEGVNGYVRVKCSLWYG